MTGTPVPGAADRASLPGAGGGSPEGPIRLRQLAAIVRMETRRCLLGRRAIPVIVLALLPVLLFGVRAAAVRLVLSPSGDTALEAELAAGERQLFAGIFQGFILRLVVFFGCVGIFTNLFRGEMVDRSLHYALLAPVRRELLALGRYIAGLLAALLLFCGSTAVSLVLLTAPRGPSAVARELLAGTGASHAAWYLAIVALACAGYGAVFLAIGLFFRNPVAPAAGVLGWEFLNFLLPPWLKKISVAYYLQSLMPVPMSHGPFAIMASPAPPWAAAALLLGLTAALLAVSMWRVRRLEILYGAE